MTKVPSHKVGNDLIDGRQAQAPSIRTGSGVVGAKTAERMLHGSPGGPLPPLKINIDMGKVRLLGQGAVTSFQFGQGAVLLSSSSGGGNIVDRGRQEEVRRGDQGLEAQYGQEAMPVATIAGVGMGIAESR